MNGENVTFLPPFVQVYQGHTRLAARFASCYDCSNFRGGGGEVLLADEWMKVLSGHVIV